jgi:hypothetical protein
MLNNILRYLAVLSAALLFSSGSVTAQTNSSQTASYSCKGFQSPFDMPLSLSKKTNRAIPLKAQLFDTDNNLITLDNITGPPPVVNVSYTSGTSTAVDETSLLVPLGASSSGNLFNFDTATQTWWFNLAANTFTASGTYTVSLQSSDSTKYQVVNADACTASCQATSISSDVACIQTYDPTSCNGDIVCQINTNQQRAVCLLSADTALNSCKAACPLTSQCTGRFVRQ